MFACQEPTDESDEEKTINENRVDKDSGDFTFREPPYTGTGKLWVYS